MTVLKKGVFALIVVGIFYVIFLFLLIVIGTKERPKNTPDTILILGARVWGETKKSARPSTVLKERLDTAIPYIKQFPEASIIVCGGQGEDEPISEAEMMRLYLITHGINEKNILLENTSTRTKENIQNAQKKKPLNNVTIITSDFHLFRAKMLAKRIGIKNVSGLPAVSHSTSKNKNYFREIFSLGYGLLFD